MKVINKELKEADKTWRDLDISKIGNDCFAEIVETGPRWLREADVPVRRPDREREEQYWAGQLSTPNRIIRMRLGDRLGIDPRRSPEIVNAFDYAQPFLRLHELKDRTRDRTEALALMLGATSENMPTFDRSTPIVVANRDHTNDGALPNREGEAGAWLRYPTPNPLSPACDYRYLKYRCRLTEEINSNTLVERVAEQVGAQRRRESSGSYGYVRSEELLGQDGKVHARLLTHHRTSTPCIELGDFGYDESFLRSFGEALPNMPTSATLEHHVSGIARLQLADLISRFAVLQPSTGEIISFIRNNNRLDVLPSVAGEDSVRFTMTASPNKPIDRHRLVDSPFVGVWTCSTWTRNLFMTLYGVQLERAGLIR